MCAGEKILLVRAGEALYAVVIQPKEAVNVVSGNKSQQIATFVSTKIGRMDCLKKEAGLCKENRFPLLIDRLSNEKMFSWADASGLFTVDEQHPLIVSGNFKENGKTYRLYQDRRGIYQVEQIVEGGLCGNRV